MTGVGQTSVKLLSAVGCEVTGLAERTFRTKHRLLRPYDKEQSVHCTVYRQLDCTAHTRRETATAFSLYRLRTGQSITSVLKHQTSCTYICTTLDYKNEQDITLELNISVYYGPSLFILFNFGIICVKMRSLY